MATRPVLHHVNLKTTRLQAMIDWYAAAIGTEVVFQNEVAAWLSNDGARLPHGSSDDDAPAGTGTSGGIAKLNGDGEGVLAPGRASDTRTWCTAALIIMHRKWSLLF